MNTSQAFSSMDNKRILWDFLLNNKIFNNIPSEKEELVKRLFESKISLVAENSEATDTVIKMNKKFISAYVKEIKNIKETAKKVSFVDTNKRESNKKLDNSSFTPDRLTDTRVITAEKHKEMRQRDFNNKLESRQKDFANMFAKNTPPDIDFSDIQQEEEEGYIENMDERISEIMSSREKDLKELFDGKPEDAKKLVDTTTPVDHIEQTHFNQKIRLNIGTDAELEDVQLIKENTKKRKKEEPVLPLHNNSEVSVTQLLHNVLENQKVILERLDNLTKL